jgi:hypothetical protein
VLRGTGALLTTASADLLQQSSGCDRGGARTDHLAEVPFEVRTVATGVAPREVRGDVGDLRLRHLPVEVGIQPG